MDVKSSKNVKLETSTLRVLNDALEGYVLTAADDLGTCQWQPGGGGGGGVSSVTAISPIIDTGTPSEPVIEMEDSGVTANTYVSPTLTISSKGIITSAVSPSPAYMLVDMSNCVTPLIPPNTPLQNFIVPKAMTFTGTPPTSDPLNFFNIQQFRRINLVAGDATDVNSGIVLQNDSGPGRILLRKTSGSGEILTWTTDGPNINLLCDSSDNTVLSAGRLRLRGEGIMNSPGPNPLGVVGHVLTCTATDGTAQWTAPGALLQTYTPTITIGGGGGGTVVGGSVYASYVTSSAGTEVNIRFRITGQLGGVNTVNVTVPPGTRTSNFSASESYGYIHCPSYEGATFMNNRDQIQGVGVNNTTVSTQNLTMAIPAQTLPGADPTIHIFLSYPLS